MKTSLDNFFNYISGQTGVKRIGQREYGHLKLKPNSLIAVHVKRNSVHVALETDDRSNSLSGDVLLEWANSSGILRERGPCDDYFNVKRGSRNKLKISIGIDIPYSSEGELESVEFRDRIIKVFLHLQNKSNGIVQRCEETKEDSIENFSAYDKSDQKNTNSEHDEMKGLVQENEQSNMDSFECKLFDAILNDESGQIESVWCDIENDLKEWAINDASKEYYYALVTEAGYADSKDVDPDEVMDNLSLMDLFDLYPNKTEFMEIFSNILANHGCEEYWHQMREGIS